MDHATELHALRGLDTATRVCLQKQHVGSITERPHEFILLAGMEMMRKAAWEKGGVGGWGWFRRHRKLSAQSATVGDFLDTREM